MNRKTDKTPTVDLVHPLPQSGGSFTVSDGALVPEGPTADPIIPVKTPDETAVKPASKEA